MPKITDLPSYTTPQDSDVEVIVDVENNTTKKITWQSIKNALKSFFDTLYGDVKGPSSATDNNIAVFDGTSGKLIKDSGKSLPTGDLVGTTDIQTLENKNIVRGINQQTGTSYTLVLSDATKIVQMNNSSANTVIIPTNSSVAFPIGTAIVIQKYGTGDTTIQGASGVTIRDPNNMATITAQYDMRVVLKIGTDEWVIQ